MAYAGTQSQTFPSPWLPLLSYEHFSAVVIRRFASSQVARSQFLLVRATEGIQSRGRSHGFLHGKADLTSNGSYRDMHSVPSVYEIIPVVQLHIGNLC